MIVFDKLWITMEKRGFTTYTLREKSGIDSKTVRRLQANDNMETKTLNKLCIALSCKLEDIAEFKEEDAK
ncbi:MAG: helix-turn-helix transcriptional regulator [Lawsonibacter sp.]|nr:helix-turn-helix transcriptional regulator [Lawsonibacter sp.]